MPWRTVTEVASGMGALGHEVTLVSLGGREQPREGDGWVRLHRGPRELGAELQAVIDKRKPDVIYWPLTWRERRWRLRLLRRTSLPLVGYFPGGSYTVGQALYAARRIGLRGALPYLVESLAESGRSLRPLRTYGFGRMIAMTAATARRIAASGWPEDRVHVIPPGRDDEEPIERLPELPRDVAEWLGGRPYLLFMGPPSAIRGVFELLDAFDGMADVCRDICLICLFRSDGVLDSERIRCTIHGMKNSARVWPEWRSMDRGVLSAFLSNTRAIVLPFVVVPSEIPLAVIEAMGWGKPIITTGCGGTGEFVGRFGPVTPLGDIDALASAMRRLSESPTLAAEKGEAARKLFSAHPTWPEVARAWRDVALLDAT